MRCRKFFLVVFAVLIVQFLLVSCRKEAARVLTPREIPKDWKTIETPLFSVSVPPTMTKNDLRGTDSQMIGFENDAMEFEIDYGLYSTTLRGETNRYKGTSEPVVIDGNPTMLISFNANEPLEPAASEPFCLLAKPYVTGVQFPHERESFAADRDWTASFIAHCKTSEAGDTAQTILASIKFKDK